MRALARAVAWACLVLVARAASSHQHHKQHDEHLQPEDKSAVVVLLDEHRKGRDTLRLLPSMQEYWPWLHEPSASRARRVPVVLFHVEGAPGSPHPFLSDALRASFEQSAPKLRLVFIRIDAKDHLGPGGTYGGYRFCSQFLAHDMYFSLGERFPGHLENLLRIDEDALIVPPAVTVDLFDEMARRGKRVANLQAGKTENTGKMNEMHARGLKFIAAERERARADAGGGARAAAHPALAEGVDGAGVDGAGNSVDAAKTLRSWFTLPCEQGKTPDFPTCRPPNFTVELLAGWAELYRLDVFVNDAYKRFLHAIHYLDGVYSKDMQWREQAFKARTALISLAHDGVRESARARPARSPIPPTSLLAPRARRCGSSCTSRRTTSGRTRTRRRAACDTSGTLARATRTTTRRARRRSAAARSGGMARASTSA